MDQIKSSVKMVLGHLDPVSERAVQKLTRISHLTADFDRVYHVHVRKTGGTSLNYGFFSIDGADPRKVYNTLDQKFLHRSIELNKVFVGWNKEFINKGRYFFAYSHLPVYKLRLPPRTFSVTCLRDPVQRVVSHYNMLAQYEVSNTEHPLRRTECRWLGDSFSDFLDRIPRQHLLNQLYMFSPGYEAEEAAERIKQCSYYFFTENYAEGIKEINMTLGLNIEVLQMRKSNRKIININADELSRLREALEPEYRLLELLQRK